MEPTSYIPPLPVSRMIGTYHFEDGQGYVAIVADGVVPTELLVEKAQTLLDLKRSELAAIAMEAAKAGETEGLDPKDDSAGRKASPNPTGEHPE